MHFGKFGGHCHSRLSFFVGGILVGAASRIAIGAKPPTVSSFDDNDDNGHDGLWFCQFLWCGASIPDGLVLGSVLGLFMRSARELVIRSVIGWV